MHQDSLYQQGHKKKYIFHGQYLFYKKIEIFIFFRYRNMCKFCTHVVYMFIKSDIFSVFIAANIYFIVIIVVIIGSNTKSFCCTVFYFNTALSDVVNSGCLNERTVGDLPGSFNVISVPLSVRHPFLLS